MGIAGHVWRMVRYGEIPGDSPPYHTPAPPSSYLKRRGQGAALWLRAVKAADVAITDLDLEVLAHAVPAVHVLALLEAEAGGAQLLQEADAAAEHPPVKHLLPLGLIEVQQLGQQVGPGVGHQHGPGVQLPHRRLRQGGDRGGGLGFGPRLGLSPLPLLHVFLVVRAMPGWTGCRYILAEPIVFELIF